MATDIQISDLTDGQVVNGAWDGNGVFDKLLSAVNANIELQYTKGRIKGTDYANVYLGGMQAVLQESLQYILQERVIEAQVDNALKDLDIKRIQEQKEQFNLNSMLPLEKDKLSKTITNLEAQTSSILKDVDIKNIQEQKEQFSLDNILPLEKDKLDKTVRDIKVATDLKEEAVREKAYHNDKLLPQQLLLTYAERIIKDKEAAALGMDNVIAVNTSKRNSNNNYVYSPFYTIPTV